MRPGAPADETPFASVGAEGVDVSLGGRAGTGKSAMALCAGLELVLERRQHAKVMVSCSPCSAESVRTRAWC